MVTFYKYQGTGNDFIMIDNRNNQLSLSTDQIVKLCDRRFGIGADGVILIEPGKSEGSHFYSNYYNSDGSQSFCGNGSRCSIRFAQELGFTQTEFVFDAIDGLHHGKADESSVSILMGDTGQSEMKGGHLFLNTGSPHVVKYVESVDLVQVNSDGSAIRYAAPWEKDGVNVNFVERLSKGSLKVRTYERGVEAETLSCGTGVTAVALIDAEQHPGDARVIITPGGELEVTFERKRIGFASIWLKGPAEKVFEGEVSL